MRKTADQPINPSINYKVLPTQPQYIKLNRIIHRLIGWSAIFAVY